MRVRTFVTVATTILFALSAQHAHADLVATVTPSTSTSGGTTTYNYVVANAVTSTGLVTEFDLALPTDANLSSITAPADFFPFYDPGDFDIMFTAFDLTGIAPGLTGTFSFTSPDAPGSIVDQLAGVDNVSGSYITIPGTTLGPADATPTPEPSTVALFGTGLLGAGRMLKRRIA